uniref:Reverse transcriptase/retrotransposon-derived protein RNase H-like domain-containing protein n=1 Tax=Lactuca sativa TaxID=4236 RepID=A0A9R1V3V1_LACSA|nr:hypothetical protein LSAT_V11C700377510 [Lactuca sativa]
MIRGNELAPKNHDLPITDDEQHLVSVETHKKKHELKDDEKEYVKIEDITDEEYGQKKVNKEGPTSSSPSVGNQKKAQEKHARTGAIVAPTNLPFPPRQSKSKVDEGKFKKFLEILSQLDINIPFVEALKQMPTYATFMKDVLTKKRVFGEFETVAMTKSCTSIIQNKLPVKKDDPGSFVLPCRIGKLDKIGLCDLGASINLMPLSIFRRLGIGEARPTTISLQLADRSVVYPEGKIEHIVIKIDNLFVPADFTILDYEADDDCGIILGRPFLATAGALIDVKKGEITLRVNDEQRTFNMFKAVKQPFNMEECSFVRVIDNLVHAEVAQLSKVTHDIEEIEEWKIKEDVRWVKEELDLKDRVTAPTLPSIEKAPDLELKQLPTHLKYAYLRDDDTLPVIISSQLSSVQEKEFVDVLKENEKAIGWMLADIKGISPTMCMHKINLEEGAKTSVEHQRRLNPLMKDVVKREIIKWLDAGIIYPIADSEWISPVHCVPKKGGATVVQNDIGEMITKRTVTGWRICIDYRKLNTATRKDHFPLPFIDQMLDRLAVCST